MPGCCLTGLTHFSGLWSQGTYGSHKFPENPIVPLPCSRTPAEPEVPSLRGTLVLPPFNGTRRASATIELSELYHTALALAVYASCRHC